MASRSPKFDSMTVDRHEPRRLPPMTILTASRNGGAFLREALESVRSQDYPELEHIVIDACSTDGSLALLKKYPDITVISEPDEGSHDALNKGIARAAGEIIGFLNVDDIYPPGVLVDVGRIFASDPEVDVVVGHSIVFEDDEAGRRKVLFRRTHPRGNGLWLPELTFGVPAFRGCFFRHRVFWRVPKLSNDLITADRQFLISVALAGSKSARLDRATIWYRLHPGSATINREMQNLLAISREYVGMALEFSRRPDVPQPLRRVFLAWHAFEGAKLFARSVWAGRLREASTVFKDLQANNLVWPVHMVHGLMLRHAVRRLDPSGGQATTPEL